MIFHTSFLMLVLCLSFIGGIFAFDYSSSLLIQKVTIIFIILFSVLTRMILSRSSLRLGSILILYSILIFISSTFYFKDLIYILASVQSHFTIVLAYLWISTLNFTSEDLRRFRYLFYLILLTQILASFGKFLIYGVDEQYFIGTMSHAAGQLSLIFPAIAIPLVFFLMNVETKIQGYILVLGLFLFAIIGEKRAAIFILPLVFFASYKYILLEELKIDAKLLTNNKFFLLASIFGLMTLGIYLIPSLNKEEIVGGSISYLYLIEYSLNYLNMSCVDNIYDQKLQGLCSNMSIDTNIQFGRFKLLLLVIDWIFTSDIKTMLFGLGYGSVTPSDMLNQGRDILYQTTGLRGAISGFGLAIIETGIFGATLITSFFIYLFVYLGHGFKKLNSSFAKRWYKMLCIIFIVFCFDFFFYSISLLRTMPLPIIFSGLIASIIVVQKIDQQYASAT